MPASFRRRPQRDDGGFVMVLLALSMVGLVLLTGFAVDLGAWYLRAAKLQRSSDLAALAATTKLPDITSARSAALSTLTRNGIQQGGDISVAVNATSAGAVNVSVTDARVETYFLKILFPSIGMTRSSSAQQDTTIPMGNPFNVFGSGDKDIAGLAKRQNFWAAVNGTCMPKEDGDYFMSKRIANEINNKHECNGGQPNPNFEDKATGMAQGYSYMVDVPAGGRGDLVVRLWDPHFRPYNETNEGRSADVFDILPGDNGRGGFDTAFVVTDTKGTPTQDDDGPPLAAKNYLDGQGPARWFDLVTIPAAALTNGGQYRIQVFSNLMTPGAPPTGVNTFSIMAYRTGAGIKACDSRTDSACPRVYSINATSVYVNASGVNGRPEFYLAEIDPAFSGSAINVFLWDPGEGSETIELLNPDGVPAQFRWTASGSSTVSAPVTALSVANSRFNGKLVTFNVIIPTSYSSRGPTQDKWWRLRYTTAASGAVTDRTTWGIDAAGIAPAHLEPRR